MGGCCCARGARGHALIPPHPLVRLPTGQHVGLIPDGSRRWGRKERGSASAGYCESTKAIDAVIKWALGNEVAYLTVFAFSAENWNRTERERTALFQELEKWMSQLLASDGPERLDILVTFLSTDTKRFPKSLTDLMSQVSQTYNTCESSMRLTLLLSYGGKQEIESAFNGEALLTSHLPDLDLIIRTGNTMRLSNFMLYKAAWAELFFLKMLFPDLREDDLHEVARQFLQRTRRFGN